MPSPPAGRSGRASTAAPARKSSTQTLKSRASASARSSALPVEIPDEGPATSLRTQICGIFAETQRNTATQRKLIINLRKIQEACCYEPTSTKKNQKQEDFEESDFNEEVGRCAIRVLTVKKSEPVGDRIVRFLGLFLKHASEKVQPEDVDTTDALPETPASRLTSHILSILLPLLTVRDKTVRFRVTQIIAHIVNTLDSIDDELFQLVRLGLLKRLRDKEANIRVQAVIGLGRLADGGEADEDDEDSDDEVAGGILEKLLDVLQNDPSAEVRRSLLLNLPFTPGTLPYLLERARDLDAATRRALYSRLLPALGDFRHLSLTHREKLLRWGLRDRDENVRKATARLFRERWIEDCAISQKAAEEEAPPQGQVSAPRFEALLELLERIDVVNSGVEGGIAFEAMKELWDGRPDYVDFITFDDDFWNDLTPESAFVARTFNDYCREAEGNKLQDMVEDKMPVVTAFAFFVQKHLNVLIDDVRKVALQDQDDADAEEDTVQQEFCVEQLLHIAMTLDYTDEVGRRQMFSIMRGALALAELPEECTKLVVDVLRTVCGVNAAGEREFCDIVLEAVAEVHDTILGEDPTQEDADESFHSARSELSDELTPTKAKKNQKRGKDEDSSEIDEEKAIREIMVNMKCLHIAQCMLQNVQCDLEENNILVTMLNNLVVPAVRSNEAPIRERGLLCLGLCCLLSKNLASENMTLFLHCFTKGHDTLQIIAVQILTDTLITHPSLLAPPLAAQDASTHDPSPINPLLKPLTKTFLRALASPSPSLPLTACLAVAKLLLLGLLPAASSMEILKALTIAYFNPETAENPALRQALTYFLPVFCHSRLSNAALMSQIAVSVIGKLVVMREEAEEEEEEMVGWTVVAGMIAEWTDGRKVVGGELCIKDPGERKDGAEEPHVLLATEILERALGAGCNKDERKPLLTLLSKLNIPSTNSPDSKYQAVSQEAFQTLHSLVAEAVETKLAIDATTRNALTKLDTALSKRTGESDKVVTTTEVEIEPTKLVDEEEETIMLGDAQAEGTVMPLDGSGEDDDDLTMRQGGTSGVTEVDDSVVDRLLDSELE
ncbi:uncharacterized protein BDZ99DRAFT_505983 [Mytilinidion resinicola]|uniref:Nuclear condensin complex subunit 3 C-terminal domain-containing protein n=1 Tax=Mytilinidion resinicola TaxID=574789 RepID=A0A6A6Z6G9_9PEZI|nr:uncharacterized protein BDZ99DRAFT_505983 [Mytilinidion resinicola]KAF2816630.1 hypothetical protein BDZ99DRAFT_505983 [Mytilinidion resinicola]